MVTGKDLDKSIKIRKTWKPVQLKPADPVGDCGLKAIRGLGRRKKTKETVKCRKLDDFLGGDTQ